MRHGEEEDQGMRRLWNNRRGGPDSFREGTFPPEPLLPKGFTNVPVKKDQMKIRTTLQVIYYCGLE